MARVGDLLYFLPLPLALMARLAVCLRLVGLQGRLPLHKLTHEVEIWGDDKPASLDVLVGVHHGHARVFHQIGDDDGGGPGHTGLTVD